MSDRDNFAGGFITGAVLGGLLGGIVGASLSRRQASAARRALRNGISKVRATSRELENRASDSNGAGRGNGAGQGNGRGNGGRRWISRAAEAKTQPVAPEARIEEARRNLENKIAQLNIAIDDARQQLNETAGSDEARSSEAERSKTSPETPYDSVTAQAASLN